MTKKFVVSTADVYGYDENENLLFRGITLIDSSIETEKEKLKLSDGYHGRYLWRIWRHRRPGRTRRQIQRLAQQ